VRPSLAFHLVDIYGGHILQITRALRELHHHHQKADIDQNFIFGLEWQLCCCINHFQEQGIIGLEGLHQLKQLMQTGFLPCHSSDNVVSIFTKYDIGRYISSTAQASCLSNELSMHETGLVPSTQMIRIVYSLL
jgi:hypothetical protein